MLEEIQGYRTEIRVLSARAEDMEPFGVDDDQMPGHLEEFEGIMLEGASHYVLTTGAQEAVEEAHEMVQAFLLRLEADKLEEFEDEPTD